MTRWLDPTTGAGPAQGPVRVGELARRDVVAVAAGQNCGGWDARAVGDEVVFRAGV